MVAVVCTPPPSDEKLAHAKLADGDGAVMTQACAGGVSTVARALRDLLRPHACVSSGNKRSAV